MSTKKQNKGASITATATPSKTFIGIDFHKRYSVYHVVDEAGRDVAKGRIGWETGSGEKKEMDYWHGWR